MLDFNKIKNIFEAKNIIEKSQQVEILKKALKSSRVVKLKENFLKRRVPFKLDRAERRKLEDCKLYVENYPKHFDISQLSKIFEKFNVLRV